MLKSNIAPQLQSFGVTTISATTPTTNSPHAMSNIALQLRRPPLPLGDLQKRDGVAFAG
jgi:hypothetical protein